MTLLGTGVGALFFPQLPEPVGEQHITRNMLAHGQAISKEIASVLRVSVIGTRYKPGILCWLAEHLDPA